LSFGPDGTKENAWFHWIKIEQDKQRRQAAEKGLKKQYPFLRILCLFVVKYN